MATIKIKQMLMRIWRKGNPYKMLMGMQINTIAMENSMEGPQITESETIICSWYPTTGYR
jgi:hypothetical protein